jgi:UDP-MurNAc hydroxylase
MKITHISNSFLLVEAGNVVICCDPWVGKANHGGWHSFPEYDRAELLRLVQRADLVYISHLHSDHFDPAFLIDSGLIGKPFVIAKFKTKTLRNRLQNLGASVIELGPFERSRFGLADVGIVPQMTSTSAGLKDDVNFDLDSSLIVHDGETFFNQADNPLSNADLAIVAEWIKAEYRKLDIAALVFGAASEYPQCFLNIDRQAEKQRIVDASLQRMRETLQILKPTVFFPAGGSYFIPGKHHGLNAFIAQPSFDEILDANDTESVAVNLEGGWTLNGERLIKPVRSDLKESIYAHRDDLYDHEIAPIAFDVSIASVAAQNWLACGVSTGWVTFDLGGRKLTYEGDEDRHLTIRMDESAFMACVTGKASWNQTLSGSLCTFEREPNVHYPNDLFSLNHFRATALRMAA